ncbi:hypothetical protein ABWW58_02435 [Sporolactobacillus sp. STCC-11]|uniref:hypothetical protein n=1 Tax=Sporolactobacillus caesalpiniae TaxID=3230362 RepID=UPI00339A4065
MNQLQVAHLVKCIVKMYPFVVADDTYMNIWLATTKHADFDATMEHFYRYVSDPKSRHAVPLPADLVVKGRDNGLSQEAKKMRQWEAEAKAHPVNKSRLPRLEVFEND